MQVIPIATEDIKQHFSNKSKQISIFLYLFSKNKTSYFYIVVFLANL
jgi:hypothetical protein